MSNLVVTAFDHVRVKQVTTPLITMPGTPGQAMGIKTVIDGDHADMHFVNQNGDTRFIINGGSMEPSLEAPGFSTQVGTLPLGGVVAFDAEEQFVPMTFPDLLAELGEEPIKVAQCLDYQSPTPGVSNLLIIDDADHASSNSYTCVGQVTFPVAGNTTTTIPLFTMACTPGMVYTITCTSAVKFYNAFGLISMGGVVGTIIWATGDIGSATSIENHGSGLPEFTFDGTGIAGNILNGSIDVTSGALDTISATVSFKVDVTRVPASIPV